MHHRRHLVLILFIWTVFAWADEPVDPVEPPPVPVDTPALVDGAAACQTQATTSASQCQTAFDLVQSVPGRRHGHGMKGAANSTGEYFGQISERAHTAAQACKEAAFQCFKQCGCPTCDNSFKICKGQFYKARRLLHIANDADSDKKKSEKVAEAIGDQDTSSGKPIEVADSGSGVDLPPLGMEEESVAETEKDGDAKSNEKPLSKKGLFGLGSENPAMLERPNFDGLPTSLSGARQSAEVEELKSELAETKRMYEALAQEKESAPADEQTIIENPNLARGQARFITQEEARRRAAGSRHQVVTAPVATQAMSKNQARAAGLPVAGNQGTWESPAMDQDLKRKRGPAAESDLAALNEKMRLTDEGGGGGGARRMQPQSAGLADFLPNGSKYNAGRGPAGANLPSNGIQSQSVDIWGLVSQRIKARCLSGRLHDCR